MGERALVGWAARVSGFLGRVKTRRHSRNCVICVICAIVPRATGRAVCLALLAAMRRYGIPDELLTDNGKQFTARFNPRRRGT